MLRTPLAGLKKELSNSNKMIRVNESKILKKKKKRLKKKRKANAIEILSDYKG